MAMHGTPAACARRATPSAVLPNAVWASMRPSPVIDEVGRCQLLVEAGRLHDEVDPWPERERSESVLDREQGEPDAARGTGPGGVALAAPGGGLERVRPRGISIVEQLDLRRGRALLRAEDGGGPVGTKERVRNVAGDLEIDVVEGATPGVERLDQAATSIGRRAPADPEGHVTCATVDRRGHQVASPSTRGGDRVTLVGGDPRQSGCFGHLDDGPRAVDGSDEVRRDRAAERVPGGRRSADPAAGGLDRGDRALAAVREGGEDDRVARARARPAGRDGPRNLDRRQRPLERVGRDEDGERFEGSGPAARHRRSFQYQVAGAGMPSLLIA